jgi:YaaC-like Protein
MPVQPFSGIKFLESTANLKAIIRKAIGISPSTEIARDISACLQQGRLFFEIASSAPPQIQPLQIFYGMAGFAKAIILARSVQSIATIQQSHGLKDVSSQNDKIEDLCLQFQGNGVFEQFNDAMAPLGRINYFDDFSAPQSVVKPFDKLSALKSDKSSLKEIFARIPDLQRLYKRTFSEDAACCGLGFYHRSDETELRIDLSQQFSSRDELRTMVESLRQKYPFLNDWCLCSGTRGWGQTILFFYNIGKSELGEFSETTLIEGPNGFVAERRNRDHIAFDTILPPLAGGLTNDHPTAIQPLNGAYLSDASLLFCGAFLLSSLVRYRPQVWQHALSHSVQENRAADDRALSLIEAFSATALGRFPTFVQQVIDYSNSVDFIA